MEKQTVINILKKNGYERYEPNHYVKGSISVNLEQLSVMKLGDDEVFKSFESLLDYLGVAEKQTVFIKRYPSKGELPKEDAFAVLTKNGKMFGFDVTDRMEWWLEEIEIPSEEEVCEGVNSSYKEWQDKGVVSNINESAAYKAGLVDTRKFILNHLKSNTNETDKI